MLRAILSRLPFVGRALGDGRRGGDSDQSESDDTVDGGGADDEESRGFRPSRLDASVLYAHGVDVERSADELEEMAERAHEIEDVRRRG